MPKINNKDKRNILNYLAEKEVPKAILNKEEIALTLFNKLSQKKRAKLAKKLR